MRAQLEKERSIAPDFDGLRRQYLLTSGTLAPPAIAIYDYRACFLASHMARGGFRTQNRKALAGRSL